MIDWKNHDLQLVAITILAAVVIYFVSVQSTYPPNSSFAAFTVFLALLLLLPLIKKVSSEE